MFTKEELVEMYIERNMSQRDIAREKGCGKSTVNYYFKKYNIKLVTVKEKTALRNRRICSTCKKEKGLDAFYMAKHNASGYSNICKSCSAVYNRKWELNNKDKVAIKNAKRRARKIAVNEDFTPDEARITRFVFRDKCFLCESKNNISIDHVYPLSLGFALSLGNACLLCKSCNSKKHNKDPLDFLGDDLFLLLTEKLFISHRIGIAKQLNKMKDGEEI